MSLNKKSKKYVGSPDFHDMRGLLKEEFQKGYYTLKKSYPTRDVSHIKDKLTKLPALSLTPLPTEIDQLKKLKESTDFKGLSPSMSSQLALKTHVCNREGCLDIFHHARQSSTDLPKLGTFDTYSGMTTPEVIESAYLGNPTGRQDIKNLREWFNYMIKHNKNPEDLDVIYSMCEKELIRQVSVQCVDRGNLLKRILRRIPSEYDLKEKQLEQKTREIIRHKEAEFAKELKTINKKNQETIKNYENEIDRLQKLVYKYQNVNPNLANNILDNRSRWREVMRMYENEKDYWDKKLLELTELKKSRASGITSGNKKVASILWKQNKLENSISKDEDFVEPPGVLGTLGALGTSGTLGVPGIAGFRELSLRRKTIKTSRDSIIDIESAELKVKRKNKGVQFDFNSLLEEAWQDLENLAPDEDFYEDENAIIINQMGGIPDVSPNDAASIIKLIKVGNSAASDKKNPYNGEEIDKDYMNANAISKRQTENKIPQFSPSIPKIDIKEIENDARYEENYAKNYKHSDTISTEGDGQLRAGQLTVSPSSRNSEDELSSSNCSIESRNFPNLPGDTKRSQSLSRQDTEEKEAQIQKEITKPFVNRKSMIFTRLAPTGETIQFNVNFNTDLSADEVINLLIPENSNKESWKEGFSTGLEFGKAQGFIDGEDFGIEQGRLAGYIKALQEKKGLKELIKNQGDKSEDETINRSEIAIEDATNQSIKEESSELWPEEIKEAKRLMKNAVKVRYNARLMKNKTDKDFGFESIRDPSLDGTIKEDNSLRVFKKAENSPDNGKTDGLKFSSYLKKEAKKKDMTKFFEFKFNQRANQVSTKKLVASGIIDRLIRKKLIYIKKKSTMSSRMVNRIINSVYSFAMTKQKSGEIIENLAEIIYDEFNKKYGLKAVIDKKFIDFIASLFKYSDSIKSMMFLKFLGYGKKLGLQDYKRLSFPWFLSCFNYMLTSKTGIMAAFDDTSNKNMFPTLRAIEYVRDKFDFFDKLALTNLIGQIEDISTPDPKRINANGLVELDSMLEIVIDSYENYQNRIEDGILYALKTVGYDENNTISNVILLILVRHILQHKIFIPPKDEDFTIDTLSPKQKAFINFMQTNEKINLDDLMIKCLDCDFFEINDFKIYFNPPKDLTIEKVLSEINAGLDEVMEILEKMKEKEEKKWKSLTVKEWKKRLASCEENIIIKEPANTMFEWTLYQDELRRIKDVYLS
ncbi:unnamed protein product [Blepharisma stoltei]|uniref:Uncharacterized protein n=1 Tax=Blepharisma stoltei TaxID=1481888 RepID=A0AAU9JCN9_9CILI|nr:unnamed protein product [Blepharisma stoltei]